MVEMKDLLAQMPHGDNAVQADSITDEMVYSQIVTDKDLRQNITMFLRARGYVSDDDLQRGMAGNQSLIDRPALGDQRGPATERLEMAQPANAQLGGSQLANSLSERYPVPLNQAATSARTEGNNVRPDREAKDSTSEPQVLRRPAPYNLASLRDLYTQIPDSSDQLKRFGSEVFVRRDKAVASFAPLDVPIGPDYVLGPGTVSQLTCGVECRRHFHASWVPMGI